MTGKEFQSTYSLQHTLSRLPIPSLEETCTLYLKSIVPLQTQQEHEKTKRIVQDFLSSDLSKSLQQRLIDIDRASPNNWLEDNFWLRKAYLEWREPLMVNSNWYILGQDDVRHPTELLVRQPIGRFSRFQVKRAAHLIRRGLEYKEMIDRQDIPAETIKGKQGLCMWQYSRLFSVTRVPLYGCDTLVQGKDAKHITIILKDQVYSLNVYSQDTLFSTDQIESCILALINHVESLKEKSIAIPLLTSSHRDHWTVARNHLLTLGNREQLTKIEDSLFTVSLDDYANGPNAAQRTKTLFCGHQGLGNGHNRWYDKSLSLVVESNGQCGFLGEHSPVDALIASWVFDYMLKEPCVGEISSEWIVAKEEKAEEFEHLAFHTDATMERYVSEAQKMADATAALSDSDVLVFKEYGTDWVKRVGRVSPDAFYQMALQLMYYRLHGKLTATYETAATRKYLRGRTETIRSCSAESRAFVESFDKAGTSAQEKYELLVKAASNHRLYTQVASDGYGCDRHLLALRLLNADHGIEMHPIFTDPIFTESQTWRLSTSGLHEGIRLMGTGFGAVYKDGYGINYMAAPGLVKFGIETKKVPETATAKQVMETMSKVLLDLKSVCEQVNHSKL